MLGCSLGPNPQVERTGTAVLGGHDHGILTLPDERRGVWLARQPRAELVLATGCVTLYERLGDAKYLEARTERAPGPSSTRPGQSTHWEQWHTPFIAHLRTTQPPIGVKVLSDVEDTMYANLIDACYPQNALYPGVLEFYEAVTREPFELPTTPVTTLSARPNPMVSTWEASSLQGLVAFTRGRLCLSALSGALVSGALGTAQTVLRANLDLLCDEVPHGQEDEIGRVKFKNLLRFSAVYPEYCYVFVGDSGQADALTAQLMVTTESTDGASRVVTTTPHITTPYLGGTHGASRQ
jgi:hypothetical protein